MHKCYAVKRSIRHALYCGCAFLLLACSTPHATKQAPRTQKPMQSTQASPSALANEVVLYALGLLNIGYRFGGNNPESGLDCSGMVAYIYQQAAGISLPHNAAQIAAKTKAIPQDALQAGDLVFFNTLKRPYSHVGLYIGDRRFVHAPSQNKVIQIAYLNTPYFAQRYHAARRVLP